MISLKPIVNSLLIEHCIIGDTFFITSSPILGAFYNNEKNYFVYFYWAGYFSKMQKLNHLSNAEKILYVIKRIRNEVSEYTVDSSLLL